MKKREIIVQAGSGIILAALLVLLQFAAIFAAAKCGGKCHMHNHIQKEVKTCCYSDVVDVSMSQSQVCSVSTNTVVVFPVIKPQLTRSSTSKVLSPCTLYLSAASEAPSQYGFLQISSSVPTKYKESALYLLDSVFLT